MALADLPPSERKISRVEKVLPLVDDFFDWVRRTRRQLLGRNLATKAFGYAENQEQELRAVLLDGRLPLDNTRSERALRKIVVGRKNWMFYGSDLHAQAAAAIFSIIASCRLHRIEPWKYLDEVLRLLPSWPPNRYIELAPKNWSATRARLDPTELEAPSASSTSRRRPDRDWREEPRGLAAGSHHAAAPRHARWQFATVPRPPGGGSRAAVTKDRPWIAQLVIALNELDRGRTRTRWWWAVGVRVHRLSTGVGSAIVSSGNGVDADDDAMGCGEVSGGAPQPAATPSPTPTRDAHRPARGVWTSPIER